MTDQIADPMATGTPGGVGHARRPAVYPQPGQRILTKGGRGRCENLVVADRGAADVAAACTAGASA